ncbi:Sec-independent protein translocase protein TatB [Methylophilus flavus]|uniref:Sec-independent protein translocase protein TatB n=1 Tax=Methylophilus flavus TaxID=640084 RepID=A0ABW3P9X6_9PROT
MFDISFSELLVIAIVALVVIGPEKLPKVARTAGAFFGRLQRFVAQVKDEVNRESRFAELQKLQDEVHSSFQQSYDDIERSILPTESQLIEEQPAEAEVVKKPRKPRLAKVKQVPAEGSSSTPGRRSKAPVKETPTVAELEQSPASQDTASDTAVSAATRRPRKPKPKPASDTPDMFVDEPRS